MSSSLSGSSTTSASEPLASMRKVRSSAAMGTAKESAASRNPSAGAEFNEVRSPQPKALRNSSGGYRARRLRWANGRWQFRPRPSPSAGLRGCRG